MTEEEKAIWQRLLELHKENQPLWELIQDAFFKAKSIYES